MNQDYQKFSGRISLKIINFFCYTKLMIYRIAETFYCLAIGRKLCNVRSCKLILWQCPYVLSSPNNPNLNSLNNYVRIVIERVRYPNVASLKGTITQIFQELGRETGMFSILAQNGGCNWSKRLLYWAKVFQKEPVKPIFKILPMFE